jgi:hypothetical protein
MSRHSHWNLIASGASGDVAIDVAQSLQYGDRYSIAIFVGETRLDLLTRELDWLGTWLGMLSLERGRGVDESCAARGIQGDTLKLVRDPAGTGFQIEYAGPAAARLVQLSAQQEELLRDSLSQALRELASQ